MIINYFFSYDIWNGAVQCLAVLDVLFSLARYRYEEISNYDDVTNIASVLVVMESRVDRKLFFPRKRNRYCTYY